ncbi:FecR family protein [Wenyingzhuangia sp. IMCC45467]
MKQNYKIDDTFLARWLNNELTDEELADFKQSEDYPLYQKIAKKSTLFSVPNFNEEQSFKNLQEKIKNQKQKVRKLVSNWVYGVAAAILIMFGLSYFMTSKTEIICNTAEQLAYVLPDGSEVRLNGNSTLFFNEKQWQKGNRTLDLEGEGYFKVKKGSNFSVCTNQGTVTVLGTQFNVQTLKKYLAVECYEGKVNVKNSKYESVLTPGKGVKFLENKKENYQINSTEPNWVTNNYQYNAVPLSVVFKDLENVYKVKVKNNGIDLSQLYSGKLVINNLEKAIKVICKPMNINYVINKDIITISE